MKAVILALRGGTAFFRFARVFIIPSKLDNMESPAAVWRRRAARAAAPKRKVRRLELQKCALFCGKMRLSDIFVKKNFNFAQTGVVIWQIILYNNSNIL